MAACGDKTIRLGVAGIAVSYTHLDVYKRQLFAGHPVVIAGVGYRIDAIGEAHIDLSLIHI